MDLFKFIDLLQSRKLRLARIDTFDDHFEGYVPILNRYLQERQLMGIIGNNMKVTTGQDPPRDLVSAQVRATLDYMHGIAIRTTYASCWYSGYVESSAMWAAYSSGGIVIQSNYAKLRDGLDSSVFIGTVSYVDYHGNTLAAIDGG